MMVKIVAGLGNPGSKYQSSRHNVGFSVLDQVAATNFADKWKTNFDSLTADCTIDGVKVLLIKPQTYMNRSGSAVRKAVDYYKTTVAELLVVCDDFSLPLGRLRLRAVGSAGGQNGLKDVIACVGTDNIARLRVGIDSPPTGMDPADFVLSAFKPAERRRIDEATIDAGRAVECWIRQGLEAAMNEFNGKKSEE